MQDPLINFQRNYEFKKLTVGLWAPIQYINPFLLLTFCLTLLYLSLCIS